MAQRVAEREPGELPTGTYAAVRDGGPADVLGARPDDQPAGNPERRGGPMQPAVRPHVLLAGPLPIEGDVIGGTKVSFAALVDALTSCGELDLDVHDLSRARRGRSRITLAWLDLTALLRLLARILDPRRRFDAVMLNTSSGGALRSGPLVWFACKLRRTPLTLRVFGGDLDLFVERAGRFSRWWFEHTVLRAERVLLQTKGLCAAFEPRARVEWWPTTRDLHCPPRGRDALEVGARRFLFLAQLRREKGVAEAVDAARSLPDGATLTVHGPAMPGFDMSTLPPNPKWSYGGAIAPEDVSAVLAAHDVLVFPTYHDGEGMPGIVVEAMQAGLPVVASNFRALSELVEDGLSGVLVPPRDEAALAIALCRLAEDRALLARLREGALAVGERYRTSRWTAKLCGWLGTGAPSTHGKSNAA
jgi:glycosyltransferase involved in cell wall biosynthesis